MNEDEAMQLFMMSILLHYGREEFSIGHAFSIKEDLFGKFDGKERWYGRLISDAFDDKYLRDLGGNVKITEKGINLIKGE